MCDCLWFLCINNERDTESKGSGPIMITVDTNASEDAVFEELNFQVGLGSTTLQLKRSQLPVGDFRVELNGSMSAVFERKKGLDWPASIQDGRILDQKARLKQLVEDAPGTKAFFIYESEKVLDLSGENLIHRKMKEKTLAGAINRTTTRDGFPVLFTKNAKSTALLLIGYAGTTLGIPEKALPHLGKRPRQVANENPTATLLRAVPGVSAQAAMCLVKSYASPSNLVAASEKELASLKLDSGRSLGPALGKKLKLFFPSESP